jgi:hypothetical protein
MVSLEQRQTLADLAEANPQLKSFQLLLAGENLAEADSRAGDVRQELLLAISSNDSAEFKKAAGKIEHRRISADSDWCQDDYLLFLLLLGNERFGRPLKFLTSVIEARRNNTNPIPQKINEVFAALERQEFGIDGEFCFLKIPFLHLADKLRLGPSEARKALEAMSEPQLFDQIPPFLQLLTQKAYDLVLTERQALATETTRQLIEGFEAHAKDLSVKEWWHIITALPLRILWWFVGAVLAIFFFAGLGSFLIGVGKRAVEVYNSEEIRIRPTAIPVVGVRELGSNLPPEVALLAEALSRRSSDLGKRSLLVTVEGAPFTTATPSFTVEVSHQDKPINNAFAFTQAAAEGVHPVTIVPVQRDGRRFRAILPEQPIGQRICLVLEFEADGKEDVQSIGKWITLRPLP